MQFEEKKPNHFLNLLDIILTGPYFEGFTVDRSDLRIDGERQHIAEDKGQDKPSSEGDSFDPTTNSSQVELVKIWGKDDEGVSLVGLLLSIFYIFLLVSQLLLANTGTVDHCP